MKKYINVHKKTRDGRTFYDARLQLPYDVQTKMRPAAKSFYGTTAAEADAKRAEYQDKLKAQDPSKKLDMTTSFGTYLTDEFLVNQEVLVETGHLSWSRYKERKSRIDRFVVQARLGKIVLGELHPAHVEAFFQHIFKAKTGTKSAEVLRTLRDDLSLAFAGCKKRLPQARAEYLDFESFKLPEVKKNRNKALHEPADVLKAIGNEKLPIQYRALLGFQFFQLVRPQDCFALKWSAVGLESATVYIGSAVKRTKLGYRVGELKTGEKGVRTIPLAPALLPILKELHRISKTEWVFPDEHNEMMTKDHFYGTYWPTMRTALGLDPEPSFYSLKTLGNSYLQSNGVSASVCQALAGHSTPRMVTEDYRVVRGAEVKAALDLFKLPA